MTTTSSRLNPFELLIAPCKLGHGSGTLYWDDGETIVQDFERHEYEHFEFKYNSTDQGASLLISRDHESSLVIPFLEIIEILNYPSTPNFDSFTINGDKLVINGNLSVYTESTKILYISTKIELTSHPTVLVEWKNLEKNSRSFSVFLVLSVIIWWFS